MYTAPEVWGTGQYDAKMSDVWSLGVTLHAMAFGSLPYVATDQSDLIEMVIFRESAVSHLSSVNPLAFMFR